MNASQKHIVINRLMNTSVEDCRISLNAYKNAGLLCDLLIQCHEKKHTSRYKVVVARISKLIKKTS